MVMMMMMIMISQHSSSSSGTQCYAILYSIQTTNKHKPQAVGSNVTSSKDTVTSSVVMTTITDNVSTNSP